MPTVMGHDIGVEAVRQDREALQRRQHRNRGRDRAVAVNQGRAEQAEGNDRAALFVSPGKQRHQSHNAAFAIIVHAHGNRDVFDRGDNDQGPENEREAAKRDGAIERLRAIHAQHRL